jgi:hypothetical protein
LPNWRNVQEFVVKHHRIDYLLILFGSLHVLLWFKGDEVISGSDFIIPFNPLGSLANISSVWYPVNLGILLPVAYLVPWLSFFSFFQAIGIATTAVERIYFYVMWSLAGISAYYFGMAIMPSRNYSESRILALAGSAFYEFNLYASNIVLAYFSYAVMPLVLGLFVRGIRTSGSKVGYLLGIGIASYGLFLDWPNVRTLFITIFILFGYTGFLLVSEGKHRRQSLLFLMASIASMFAVMSWFLLPVASVILRTGSINLITAATQPSFGDWGYATLLEVVRLAGASNFSYTTFYSFYYSPSGLILSYLVPIIAFSAVLIRPKDGRVLFCAAMAIVFIVLGAGPNPPLGSVYQWFVNQFWFLREFRTSWYNLLGVALFYSVLIGITTSSGYRCLTRIVVTVPRGHRQLRLPLGQIGVIVIVSLLILASFPLLTTGRVSPRQYTLANLPSSYNEADSWLSSQPGYTRVVTAPSVPGYAQFSWTGAPIGNPYPLLLSVPFIGSAFSQSYTAVSNSDAVSRFYSDLQNLNDLGYVGRDSTIIGYWPLDEGSGTSAKDASGNGNLGVLVNSPAWQSGGNCRFNGCLEFQKPNSQYIDINPYPNPPESFTLSAWIKTTQADAIIVYHGGEAAQPGFMMHLNSGSLECEIHSGSISDYILSSTSYNDNNWHDVACVFASGSSLAGYADGVPVGKSTTVLTTVANSNEFRIASDFNGNYFTGRLDDIRIYSGALATYQIQELYSSSPAILNFRAAGSAQATEACGALRILSARYVFYDGYADGSNPQAFQKIAPSLGLEPSNVFGSIHLYATSSHNPHIYASTNFTIENDLSTLLASACSSSGNYLGFLKDQVDKTTLNAASSQKLSSPTVASSSDGLSYRISIQNATSPFYLILSESFSPYWQASIDSQPLPHSEANSYANAWYISKLGNFEVKIQYFPNLLSQIGLLVSIAFAIVVLAVYMRQHRASRRITKELVTRSKR